MRLEYGELEYYKKMERNREGVGGVSIFTQTYYTGILSFCVVFFTLTLLYVYICYVRGKVDHAVSLKKGRIIIKTLLDANIIRNIISNIFHFNVGFFEVFVIYSILESNFFNFF